MTPERGTGIFNYRKKFIRPESFEKQVAWFTQKYTILQLDEAVQRLQDGTLPSRSLVITFDDGYRNFYDYAYPILKKYSAPATIFLATDFVIRNEPLWVDRLEYAVGMSDRTENKEAVDATLREELKHVTQEEKLRRLSEIEKDRGVSLTKENLGPYAPLTKDMCDEMRGLVTFGAHTKSHPILTSLRPEEIVPEISDSKKEVAEWAGAVSAIFAYPNGQASDLNPQIIESLTQIGFTASLTTLPGVNTPQTPLYELKRYTLDNTDNWPAGMVVLSGIKQWIGRK